MKSELEIDGILKEYLFLSKEMLKFTSESSFQVFEDLVKQREYFINKLKLCEYNEEYVKSDICKNLIQEITDIDKILHEKVLQSRNLLKNNFELSNVYEGIVGEYITTGNRFDSKFY